jgi:hypothetical protein
MNNCCDNSFYRTAYNKNYQNVYCNLAQSAKTNLQNVVTSGWSMNKQLRENYGCGGGMPKNNNAPIMENYGCGGGMPKNNNAPIMENYGCGGGMPKNNNAPIVENYCGCGLSKAYLNTPMIEGYEKPYKFSISNTGKMVKENYENECKTDFLRTPYDIQYQNLYCNMAQKGRSTISGNFSYNP